MNAVPHGADQREIALIGAGENQPPVGVLENIDVVGIEQAPDDDLARSGLAPTRGGGTRNTVSATDAVQAPVALASALAVIT